MNKYMKENRKGKGDEDILEITNKCIYRIIKVFVKKIN